MPISKKSMDEAKAIGVATQELFMRIGKLALVEPQLGELAFKLIEQELAALGEFFARTQGD